MKIRRKISDSIDQGKLITQYLMSSHKIHEQKIFFFLKTTCDKNILKKVSNQVKNIQILENFGWAWLHFWEWAWSNKLCHDYQKILEISIFFTGLETFVESKESVI